MDDGGGGEAVVVAIGGDGEGGLEDKGTCWGWFYEVFRGCKRGFK